MIACCWLAFTLSTCCLYISRHVFEHETFIDVWIAHASPPKMMRGSQLRCMKRPSRPWLRERFFCSLDPVHVPVLNAKYAAFLARPRTSDGATLPTQALVATHAEPLPDIGAGGIIVHSHHQTGRHQQHRRARGWALRLLASCKILMQRFEPSSNFVLLFECASKGSADAERQAWMPSFKYFSTLWVFKMACTDDTEEFSLAQPIEKRMPFDVICDLHDQVTSGMDITATRVKIK